MLAFMHVACATVCPDLHPEHNAYWQTLAGTSGDVQPT